MLRARTVIIRCFAPVLPLVLLGLSAAAQEGAGGGEGGT